MSTHPYTKRDDIADSIQRYGFAAAIEVTNSLSGVERENKNTHEIIKVDVYETKTEQAKLAKKYLESLADGRAKIMAGIAYNGDLVDPKITSGLDFLIDINCYNPGRLDEVANEMVRSEYLNQAEKQLLEKALACYSPELPLASFFANSQIKSCSDCLGIGYEEYMYQLPHLKGLCMELYIRHVFDGQLEDKIILHRKEFDFREMVHGKNQKTKHSDADNIVICSKAAFYEALKNIQANDEFTTWLNSSSIEDLVG